MFASECINTALGVFGLLAVILYSENYLTNTYYQPSIQMIKDRQAETSEQGKMFFVYVSALGSGYAYLVYFFAFMWYTGITQLHRVAYYGVFFTAMGFMMNMSKLGYAQFRPFEIDADVKMWDNDCPKEYGNPSGHAMFAPAFGGLITLDILTTCLRLTDVQQVVMALGSAFVYFLMAYSRFILGVHALNQVIFGLVLGIWLAVAWHLLARKVIFNYIQNTIYQNSNINQASAGTDFLMALFFMGDLVFIQYVMYYNRLATEQIPEGILANVKAKCVDYNSEDHFGRGTEYHIGISCLGFFFFTYVVAVKQFFPHGFGVFPLFMGIAGVCE